MAMEDWRQKNIEKISKSIAWLKEKPQGVIYKRKLSNNHFVIMKKGEEISLYFANDSGTKLSGIMSEIDLTDPMKLIFGYTRTLLLCLLWRNDPKRVYMVGYAGGRIPMILHHYYTDLVIESTEVDADVIKIAKRFFGAYFDDRQKIILQDGRTYLADRSPMDFYDFIIIDAFSGIGVIPNHLSTVEFFTMCKNHLVDGGVLAMNLVDGDPLFRTRISTMGSVFQHIYFVDYDTAKVVFGTNAPRLQQSEMIQRASEIESKNNLSFPLVPSAKALRHISELDPYLSQYSSNITVLSDNHLGDLFEKPAATKRGRRKRKTT